ncbi:hypothetical protein OAF26_01050 [Akkermansiaceae bacterium]|nr:hypothetical protein [Akkermansiaceae bacterium]
MRYILSLLAINPRDEALDFVRANMKGKTNEAWENLRFPKPIPKLLTSSTTLQKDPGETINLHSKAPRVVAHLKSLLEESKKSGRTS